jgi:hypothetical protein
VAAFFAAPLQDLATILGLHASAEALLSTLLSARLVCLLAHICSLGVRESSKCETTAQVDTTLSGESRINRRAGALFTHNSRCRSRGC